MNAKNGIKIVKRVVRDESSAGQTETARSPQGARKASATQRVSRQVTAWVKEFQQRQAQEAGRNFASLFQRA